MDIQSALKKGQSILIDNNIISAKLDSEILMSQAIRKNKNIFINYLIFILISTPKLLLVVNISFLKIP